MLVLSVFMDRPWLTKDGVLTGIMKAGTPLPAPSIKLPQPPPTLPPSTQSPFPTCWFLLSGQWYFCKIRMLPPSLLLCDGELELHQSPRVFQIPMRHIVFFSLRQALPFLPPAKLQLLSHHLSEWNPIFSVPTEGQRRNSTTVPLVSMKEGRKKTSSLSLCIDSSRRGLSGLVPKYSGILRKSSFNRQIHTW